jgi:hypothetical protein
MTKREELTDPTSCLSKAGEDEPIFVIRAKDPLAVATVMYWANVAMGVHEPDKIEHAKQWTEQAEKWFLENASSVTPFFRRLKEKA